MAASPLDSDVFRGLFSDPEIARHFDDAAEVQAMLRVEGALARVQGRLGVIPGAEAERISSAASRAEIDPRSLAAGTEAAGVPVGALVRRLGEVVGERAAAFVHFGATSQDVVDTGLVLRLRPVVERLDSGLAELVGRLAALADGHRATVMAARTRGQQAVPTTFGLKAAGWLAPLARHRRRLAELSPRLLVLQFGGAAGTLAALGSRGIAVMEALADELGLAAPAAPWHSQRDSLAEFAGWLSLVTGALGKMGQDAMLLAQTEVAEIGVAGGGSSTMPQKANPIAAEVLVAAARMNAGLLASVHQALVHDHERGGAGWQLEWLALPQMACLAGGALRHARGLADGLDVRADRMRLNVEASNGAILAEAAAFALAAHVPRREAEALVAAACREAAETGTHLMDVLNARTRAPIDWRPLKDPSAYLGAADALIDRALAAARQAGKPGGGSL
jgi:3-carboxy-cis,cis-muconate cycloisomerase